MKRKTYLILIWSITLCVIVCSATFTFIRTKGVFTKVWNDITDELEESFDFKFNFKNKDWNSDDYADSDSDDYDYSSGKEFKTNLEEFSKLDVDGNIMSIQIKEGDTWLIECSYSHKQLKPEFTNKDGVLRVGQKSQVKHLAGSKKCDLLITVPANTELAKANVKVNIGEIEISDLTVKNLDTNVNIGEIELDSVKFDNLDGEVNIGDFKIEDFKDFDDFNANLKADLGEIKINRNSYGKKMTQKRNTSKKMDIEINIGQLEIN